MPTRNSMRRSGGRPALRSRVPPLYPLTRAREGRADLSAVGQQRDPLAPPAGRRRHIVLAESGWGRTMELGRSGRSIMRPLRRRHSPRATGHRQTGGAAGDPSAQHSVTLTRAESSCARGAPSQRRRSAERPTFRWSAERPAIRPTRSRRLGGASAISFLGRTIDHAAPRRRARAVRYGVSPNRRH
jgi:hypothetical protein